MSVPGRLHITWQDDNTLKVETDAGMQTRLLRFGDGTSAAPNTPRDLAGRLGGAVADAARRTCRCSLPPGRSHRRTRRRLARPAGRCKSSRRTCAPGYLRKNGVPYSENAVLTEYWDLYKRPNGEEWLTITTQVDDPQYLSQREADRAVFKKEPNGAKWDPTPCSSRW